MSWTDDKLDLALRDLRDEELSLGSVEAVRARVLDQISTPRRPWCLWAWAPALAAALAVVWLVPRPSVPPPPVIAKAPATPELQPLVRSLTVAAPLESAPKPSRDRKGAEAVGRVPPTRLVKLITDDPNVVILWAMNSEGDSQ